MAFGSNPFGSARLKVQRANRHIEELQTLIADLASSDYYELVVKADSQTGSNTLSYVPLKPIPQSFPLIIGDAVHNLRAALDHIALECIRSKGGTGKDIHFPFHKIRQSIVSSPHLSAIEKALPGSKRLIIDEVKPHTDANGDQALWAVNKLDNIDKHNLLIVTTKATFVSPFIIAVEGNLGVAAKTVKFDAEKPLCFFVSDTNITVGHKVKATFDVFFSEPDPIKDNPVVPTLRKVSQRIGEIIELFSALV